MRLHPTHTSADDLTWAEVHDFEALEWDLRNLAHQVEDTLSTMSRLSRHPEIRSAAALMKTWAKALMEKPEGTSWQELDDLLVRAGSEHARMGGVAENEEPPY